MRDLVKELKDLAGQQDTFVVTAESCTGGLIAATITDLPGSSGFFDRGFVTYSNQSKIDMLGVDTDILSVKGAVSKETAEAMAQGALENSKAGLAVSCTGIAGPDGATETKPVGLVYIGLAAKNGPVQSYEHHFDGNRQDVREKTVFQALRVMIDYLGNKP